MDSSFPKDTPRVGWRVTYFWQRNIHRTGACRLGPDVVLQAPAATLYDESWASRSGNPRREQITYPVTEWAEWYVRTAVIRAPGWREGLRGPKVRSAAKAAEILAHQALLDHERMTMLLLDRDWRLLAIHETAVGGLHGCALTPRDVMRVPFLVGASIMILAHNHPSGDPTPSDDDVRMTAAVARACVATGIRFAEHLVLSRAMGHRAVAQYASAQPERYERIETVTGFPQGTDTNVTKPPTPSEELALRPYGRLARFVMRTAMVEAPGREGRPRPRLRNFDDFLRAPPVQRLYEETRSTLVTFCVDGTLGLLAVHAAHPAGAVHLHEARSVYAVAATVPTSTIMLAHNHVDKNGRWDEADRRMTHEIMTGLEPIGLNVAEHVVVSGQSARSVMH